MLVLEATDQYQGRRPSDYHHATTGELVYLPFQECCDPACGCTRGFAGFDSHRATSTAVVADRPDLTIEELCRLLAVSLYDGKWLTDPDPTDEVVTMLATEIVELANSFGRHGPGAVIEREGEDLLQRMPRTAEDAMRYLQRLDDWDERAS